MGLINYICLSFQHFYSFYIGRGGEAVQPFPPGLGEFGVGAVQCPHPHTEILYIFVAVQGGTVWVSNGLMVWSILTVVYGDGGMQIHCFVFFSPQGIYVPCI